MGRSSATTSSSGIGRGRPSGRPSDGASPCRSSPAGWRRRRGRSPRASACAIRSSPTRGLSSGRCHHPERPAGVAAVGRSGGSCSIRRWQPMSPGMRSRGASPMGLDPHVNHLERFIIRADDPNADDYSAFLGARAELVPDIGAAIVKPVTKVISIADVGVPARSLRPARAAFAGTGRGDAQPPALPRVRRAGRQQGPGAALARPASSACRWPTASPSATSGTTSR